MDKNVLSTLGGFYCMLEVSNMECLYINRLERYFLGMNDAEGRKILLGSRFMDTF